MRDARWSQEKKVWHLPDTPKNRSLFKLPQIEDTLTSPEGLEHIKMFIRWLSAKRYSSNTIKTYSEALRLFLVYFRYKTVSEINNADVLNFINDYILKKNLSASYQNQIINVVKLYFTTIKESDIIIDKIERPKIPKTLPNVLSKDEVKNILEAHSNMKHKIMLSLIYSCGLRCSELLQLRPLDIDSKRNIVLIKQAKGKKDRITPLSPKILELLRIYYQLYRPKTYLFEGQEPCTIYSAKNQYKKTSDLTLASQQLRNSFIREWN